MATLKLVTGKDHVIERAMPTPLGVMYQPTGLIMPGGFVDVTIIPWERIASFTFADKVPPDMMPE